MPSHTATATQAVKSTTSWGGREGRSSAERYSPVPRGDWKERPRRPRAAGLLFTEDDQPIGGPGHGLALGLRIGGVDDIQAYQPASHMAARQRSGQFPLPDPVRGTLQPIAPLGGGLDLIPLLPQGLNGLPHRRPADAQRPAHGLS